MNSFGFACADKTGRYFRRILDAPTAPPTLCSQTGSALPVPGTFTAPTGGCLPAQRGPDGQTLRNTAHITANGVMQRYDMEFLARVDISLSIQLLSLSTPCTSSCIRNYAYSCYLYFSRKRSITKTKRVRAYRAYLQPVALVVAKDPFKHKPRRLINIQSERKQVPV